MDLRPTSADEPVAPLAFTGDELAAIAGALAGQGTKMSRAALSAARKVVAAEPQAVLATAEPEERLAEVVQLRPNQVMPASRFTVDDEIRDVLEQSVESRRVVRIVYSDGRGRPSDREVEPAGVLAAAGRWYLIGWCRTRREGRGFRLDRVLAAHITSEPVPERPLADVLGPLAQTAE